MKNNLAIIGSGATAIYVLKHLLDSVKTIKQNVDTITIFEKSEILGMGMPYSPENTDLFNLANISSEEIPELPQSLGNWLREQTAETLNELNINAKSISDSEVYSRLALGRFFHAQYLILLNKLKDQGITVEEKQGHEVTDLKSVANKSYTLLEDSKGMEYKFSKVIIAMGHSWDEPDNPKKGYYASPWPIKKIIPQKDKFYNFTIGILGASLSAFDVVTSLAHRHGQFTEKNGKVIFEKNKKAPLFKMMLHSSEGLLPHLQYEQNKPKRIIYRHVTKEKLLSLIDKDGFLPLKIYFDKVCRPALIKAFKKDGMLNLAENLKDTSFDFKDFISVMSAKHEYVNSFKGMEKELIIATDLVENNNPISWMEILDDLMYCLNFHAELLSAEDQIFIREEVMSFLMNVIAALPLSSAKILIALHNAGCIDLTEGKVEVIEKESTAKDTLIEIQQEDKSKKQIAYQLFVNCTGQKNLDLVDYPFQTLVKTGQVRKAKSRFKNQNKVTGSDLKRLKDKLVEKDSQLFYYTGGIDVDPAYRIVSEEGTAVESIHDISFTHISGVRPYSYGLQACSITGKIVMDAWVNAIKSSSKIQSNLNEMTTIYKQSAG